MSSRKAKKPTISKAKSEPRLRIQLKRLTNGGAALTCTRADGSIIWQRQDGSRGVVFPTHDLTHFAVETVLGYANGFYGLLAAGWEFGDFAAPWPRGPIPAEAREVELLVGLFEVERRMGGGWSAAQLQEQAKLYSATQKPGRKVAIPVLRDDEVVRLHAALQDLLARWSATHPDETLDLEFIAAPGQRCYREQ